MPRKSPVRHGVKTHVRKGKNVNQFQRGKGDKANQVRTSGSSASILKQRQKKLTIDEHKRELKKIGDKISYLDNGKRVSGEVVGIRSEYYLVERNGQVWKVDRHSIFTRVGSALKGAHAKALTAGREGVKAAKSKLKGLAERLAEAREKRQAKKAIKLEATFKTTKKEVFQREAERINWRDWKKDMEKEEKINLEREKAKIRAEKETSDYHKRISEGPAWKRALKRAGQEIAKEAKKQAKASKAKPKRKQKKKTKKKVKSKPKGKTITIKVS